MSISANFPAIRPSLLLDFADTRLLDPRITFTRASTASYYDQITSTLAEQNLLTYSQDLSNAAWSKSSASVTANSATAPDTTTTANTLLADGTSNPHNVVYAQTAVSVTRTYSVYAKAGTNNFFQIWGTADANCYADFDLSTGTVGTVGSAFSASIVSVGSGWYRCIVTTSSATLASFANAIVTSSSAARNETNTLATSVYLWGAQVEQRSTVTAYTVTTTAAITNYIPVLLTAASGAARFDCNPTTRESLGLLIEESRTNLLTYSDQFDNAAWTKTACSVTANTIVAPDGTLTGDKFIPDTANSVHTIAGITTVVSGTAYMFSVYLKAGGETIAWLWQNVGGATASFDLSAGTATGTGIITAVGNGWYRCAIPYTPGSTSGQVRVYARQTTAYVSDGYSGLFIWGGQLEAGAFATSYIPTVASQVTRAADAASMTGTNFSSWFNIGQGSLYSEFFKSWTVGTSTSPAQLSSPTVSQGVMSWINTDGVNSRQWVGTTSTTMGSLSLVLSNKTAVSYGSSNAGSLNGAAAVANTGTFPSDMNTLNIGKYATGYLNGTIKRIAYYPLRVTNTQLQALTA